MVRYCIIVSILFLSVHCSSKFFGSKRGGGEVDSMEVIDLVDPIFTPSHVVEGLERSIRLPDSLGGENVRGEVYLNVILDDSMNIVGARMMMANIRWLDRGEEIRVMFSFDDSLPQVLRPYLEYLYEYAKRNARIIEWKGAHGIKYRLDGFYWRVVFE